MTPVTQAQIAMNLRALVGVLENNPARVLQQNGIVGRPNACESCPLAHYFNIMMNKLGIEGDSYINEDYLLFFPYHDEQGSHYVRLPKKVIQFIDDFDAGKYPNLVQT